MESWVHLFKYFEPARVDVIKNGCIRLTQPLDFNDPFEFKPVISTVATQDEFKDTFEQNIDKQIEEKLSKIPTALAKQISKKELEATIRQLLIENQDKIDSHLINAARQVSNIYHEKSNELIGVLCLTEKKDNLLMWSHYADSHKGFCIKFNTSHKFFNKKRTENDEFYHLREVVYLEKRPNKTMSNMSGVDLLLQKSNIWAYEKEWRFCGVLHDSDYKIDSEPLNVHLFKFPKSIIQEIILGVNASSDLEQEMKLIIIQTHELSHVKLSKAKISEKHYSLEFNDL
jgi:hypothetical protein